MCYVVVILLDQQTNFILRLTYRPNGLRRLGTFYILLTVHLGIILVNNQIGAKKKYGE